MQLYPLTYQPLEGVYIFVWSLLILLFDQMPGPPSSFGSKSWPPGHFLMSNSRPPGKGCYQMPGVAWKMLKFQIDRHIIVYTTTTSTYILTATSTTTRNKNKNIIIIRTCFRKVKKSFCFLKLVSCFS